MKFQKFPVTSKNGNEYLVDIYYIQAYGVQYLTCELYKREQIKTKYLKRNKFIDISLYEYVCAKGYMNKYTEYEYESYKNNYKEFAMFTVEKYESEKDAKELKRQKEQLEKDNNIKEFSEWDGKCI